MHPLDVFCPPKHRCLLCLAVDVPMVWGICGPCLEKIPEESRLRPIQLDRVQGTAAFTYTGAIRSCVHALKFQSQGWRMPDMALWLCHALGEEMPDLLVPVPSHPLRTLARGFSQSRQLTLWMGRDLQVPVLPRALRRWQNVPAAFRLTHEERAKLTGQSYAPGRDIAMVAGRHVTLVDDIVTTGTTVNACARILMEAGAARVDVVCFALARAR